ncbi:MAG: putative CXXCH cytochrome family protein [Planctomycetota bacterium]
MVTTSRFSILLRLCGALIAAPVAVLLGLSYGFDPVEHAGTRPLVHRRQGFVGAASCLACHADHHASWSESWHATMTQRPTPESVQGAFDGKEVGFYGKTARPYADGDKFLIDLPRVGGGRRTAAIALVVGSHEYQQYFEVVERGEGRTYQRLQLVWNIADKRWLHINGMFLEPDNPNWHERAAVWNENCIFCHNTGPEPGSLNWDEQPGAAGIEFDSHVADLGIACESCHGPGAQHVATFEDPAQRYAAYSSGSVDTHIIDPKALAKEESVSMCGQCHGQRIPKPMERIGQYMQTGPTFRSGDCLEDHVSPVSIDTQIAEHSFWLRFWQDGTPRLSAYEYQGVVESACYLKGEMTCLSCHTQHSGQRDEMIKDGTHGDAACLQCHTSIASDIGAHTKHDPSGSGSRCLECHMPRITYGLRKALCSHRIEIPDPATNTLNQRPDACTLCHLDKSSDWAATQMQALFGAGVSTPIVDHDSSGSERAHALVSLLSGDPVQRVVYATALSKQSVSISSADRALMRIALIASLGDGYATVREVAQKSLLLLEDQFPTGIEADLRAYDSQSSSLNDRRAFVNAMLAQVSERLAKDMGTPDIQHVIQDFVRLLDQQPEVAISIGE